MESDERRRTGEPGRMADDSLPSLRNPTGGRPNRGKVARERSFSRTPGPSSGSGDTFGEAGTSASQQAVSDIAASIGPQTTDKSCRTCRVRKVKASRLTSKALIPAGLPHTADS